MAIVFFIPHQTISFQLAKTLSTLPRSTWNSHQSIIHTGMMHVPNSQPHDLYNRLAAGRALRMKGGGNAGAHDRQKDTDVCDTKRRSSLTCGSACLDSA